MIHPRTIAAWLLLGLAAGAATSLIVSRDVAPTGTVSCLGNAKPMLRLELVFGMGRKGRPDVTGEEWRAFLDAEVTPRFPDGLTVLDGYGQWRNASGAIAREPSRMLLVWLDPGPQTEVGIESLRAAWKARHDQQSVLRAESRNCVSF